MALCNQILIKTIVAGAAADHCWMYAGRLKYPLALAAASENVALELAGWRTSTGMLLRKPILASLQLTPDVARYITTVYHNP